MQSRPPNRSPATHGNLDRSDPHTSSRDQRPFDLPEDSAKTIVLGMSLSRSMMARRHCVVACGAESDAARDTGEMKNWGSAIALLLSQTHFPVGALQMGQLTLQSVHIHSPVVVFFPGRGCGRVDAEKVRIAVSIPLLSTGNPTGTYEKWSLAAVSAPGSGVDLPGLCAIRSPSCTRV